LAVCDPTGRMIGNTGLHLTAPKVAEIGYWLAEEAWGRGYASTITAQLIKLARQIGLHKLTATAALTNPASKKVLEKSGFQVCGVKDRPLPDGTFRPSTVFEYIIS
jgi:RimJ/RimL family protein N-acetyltransferase